MKTIKYILSAILLLGANYMNAQYVNIYDLNPPYALLWSIKPNCTFIPIYTPNNTSVTVELWVNTDWNPTQKNDIKNYYLTHYDDRIDFEAEATAKYNCHAWAWAGNTGVWMNMSEAEKYFSSTDKSYYPTVYLVYGTNTYADKVWWGNKNHSANTTSTNGYFSSKWGGGPRFKHSYNDCPYYPATLTYYSRHIIEGSSTVYYTPTQYNLTNTSGLGTIYWTLSNTSSLQLNSSSGNSTTVTRVGVASSGQVTLDAHTGSVSGPVVASMNITPVSVMVSGPYYVNCGDYLEYSVPYIPGASYSWSSDNGHLLFFQSSGNTANFFVKGYGNFPNGWAQDNVRCTITYGGVTYNNIYTQVYIECY